MKNNNAFDDIAKTITGMLPDSMSRIPQEIDSNIKAALQSGLAKMDLVTREEFDIQVALLQRSREKLDQLEKMLAELVEDKKG